MLTKWSIKPLSFRNQNLTTIILFGQPILMTAPRRIETSFLHRFIAVDHSYVGET